MSESENEFHKVGASIHGAVKGQLFGKPCYKIGTKAFVCFYDGSMVFKLTSSLHTDALALHQSQLFDPAKKGRPMKEWVQVSYSNKNFWPKFTTAAAEYITEL